MVVINYATNYSYVHGFNNHNIAGRSSTTDRLALELELRNNHHGNTNMIATSGGDDHHHYYPHPMVP